MKNKKVFLMTLSLLVMFLMGLALRVMFLPANTIDMKVFNLKWYDYIIEHGRFLALGDEFSNYTPPYLYLLSLATWTQGFLPKLTAIKLIPILFDALNSFLIYRIVKIQHQGFKPAFAAMTFWLLPTVMVNSAFWGQADALYTFFILLCVWFALNNRWIAAVIAFSVSFAVKAQGIFILPFLAIFFFKKQIRWHVFLLAPLIYFAIMLPSWLVGRSLTSLANIYLGQADTFNALSMNAPNLYFFAPQNLYSIGAISGILLAAFLLFLWSWMYGTKREVTTPPQLILSALVSLALVPFLLPKMHDRYFYPADVFSLIAAFFIPEIWFVPIAYQVVSMLSYLPYLFGTDPQSVLPVAIFINIIMIGFLLWKQRSIITSDHDDLKT
jgi:Gpi18-like mannosyltransferase